MRVKKQSDKEGEEDKDKDKKSEQNEDILRNGRRGEYFLLRFNL
jgi:hypothetical protein